MATHRIGGTTMDKQQVLAFLSSQNIPYEITEHAAVYNMAEAAAKTGGVWMITLS